MARDHLKEQLPYKLEFIAHRLLDHNFIGEKWYAFGFFHQQNLLQTRNLYFFSQIPKWSINA